jgi:hypothetical protein
MPPRYAYWTILVDGAPTAFRAREREELLATLHQLQRKNANAEMQWFARGRLWPSREAEHEDFQRRKRRADAPFAKSPEGGGERRNADWRPGGAHKDPRDRFKKRNRPERAWSEEKRENRGAPPPDRPWQGGRTDAPKARSPKPEWRDKKPSDRKPVGRKPFGKKPFEQRPRGDRPWQNKASGDRTRKDRPWAPGREGRRDKPWQEGKTGGPPRGDKPWRDRKPDGPPRGDRPWGGKPQGAPRGDRPWGGKPQARGWKPQGDDRKPEWRRDRPKNEQRWDRKERPGKDHPVGAPRDKRTWSVKPPASFEKPGAPPTPPTRRDARKRRENEPPDE